MKLSISIALPMLLALAATASHAQTAVPTQGSAKSSPSAGAVTSAMSRGEVLKVDAKGKKILLKHGPIANLGMGPMTMEYGVTDTKALVSVKAGDKVQFLADQVKGEYVVTRIEVAK
jgi:Cu/Ag efflux protein CusF